MKIDTHAPVLAPNMANYSMLQTTDASVPGMHGAALHPMQTVYSGMQLQQQLHQQQPQLVQQQMPMSADMEHPYAYNDMPGATTQSVSVVDFKPNVVADHYARQLEQQYHANTAALAATARPTIGLIGQDGRYTPAVNACATPGVSDYSTGTHVGGYTPMPHTGGYVADPHHRGYAAMHPPHGYSAVHPPRGYPTMYPPGEYRHAGDGRRGPLWPPLHSRRGAPDFSAQRRNTPGHRDGPVYPNRYASPRAHESLEDKEERRAAMKTIRDIIGYTPRVDGEYL